MSKHKIGDMVKIAGTDEVHAVTFVDKHDSFFPYQLSNGDWYSEGQLAVFPPGEIQQALEPVVKAKPEIEVVYKIDGFTFENREAAVKHRQKIQLFDLLNTGDNPGDYESMRVVIEALINNSDEVIEILEG